MKIRSLFIMAILLLALLLPSCGQSGEADKSFGEDFLRSAAAEGLPLPAAESSIWREDTTYQTETMAFTCQGEDVFQDYVRTVIEWFSEREDIYYFGLQDSSPSMLIFLPEYTAMPIEDNFDYNQTEYAFIYSLTADVYEGNLGYVYATGQARLIRLSCEEAGDGQVIITVTMDQDPISTVIHEDFFTDTPPVILPPEETDAESRPGAPAVDLVA